MIAGLFAAMLLGQSAVTESPGAALVSARCISCHAADLISQQRLSRAGWTREVDKMIRWGAAVVEADREPLIAYLAAAFAPAPATAYRRTTEGEAVYKSACLVCHEADLVQQQRLSRAAWTREVDKMVRWGAQVSPSDADALADFLASRFGRR